MNNDKTSKKDDRSCEKKCNYPGGEIKEITLSGKRIGFIPVRCEKCTRNTGCRYHPIVEDSHWLLGDTSNKTNFMSLVLFFVLTTIKDYKII
ncbi:hypothetical protein M0R01_02900 [bacterium]|nr:hypothetical protein [bacterium]